MNKLIDLIDSKKFVIIVSLPKNDPALARATAECNADAIKVHTNVEHRASGTVFGSWDAEKNTIKKIMHESPIITGIMPGADILPTEAELRDAAACGIDFFDIYLQHMPDWMTRLPLSVMAALSHDYTDADINKINKVANIIEASIVNPEEYRQPLTAADLCIYKTITEQTDKPVIVPSQKHILPEDIPALKETGISGIMLGTISLGDTYESIKQNLPGFIHG